MFREENWTKPDLNLKFSLIVWSSNLGSGPNLSEREDNWCKNQTRNHPDAVVDSKTVTAELPEVEAVHKWLKIGDKDVPRSVDIFAIVERCLKDIKELKCEHTVKMMTQLIVILEYAKLQEYYWAHSKSKKPCLNASLAIEHWMGKGFHFAWQIHQNETYLLWHCISKCTAIQWLKKLEYTCKDVWKGIYHDEHEWPDVIEAWKNFLVQMSQCER